jgi:hypothetical protein
MNFFILIRNLFNRQKLTKSQLWLENQAQKSTEKRGLTDKLLGLVFIESIFKGLGRLGHISAAVHLGNAFHAVNHLADFIFGRWYETLRSRQSECFLLDSVLI